VFSRREPEPSGNLSAILERPWVTERCYERGCCQHTDTVNSSDSLTLGTGVEDRLEPFLVLSDPAIKLAKLIVHIPEHFSRYPRYTIRLVINEQRQRAPQPGYSLSNRNTELSEIASCLVHERRSLPDEPFANSMKHQDARLLRRLDRNKSHVRTTDRFADTLGIVPIVLISKNIWLDELRGDQANIVAETCEEPSPVVRA
jgi:hypothetical protein